MGIFLLQNLIEKTLNYNSVMNEIILTFDHLLTQLVQIGLRVKVSKCNLWNPLAIFLSINFSRLHFGCVSGFLKLWHAFFERGFILGCDAY